MWPTSQLRHRRVPDANTVIFDTSTFSLSRFRPPSSSLHRPSLIDTTFHQNQKETFRSINLTIHFMPPPLSTTTVIYVHYRYLRPPHQPTLLSSLASTRHTTLRPSNTSPVLISTLEKGVRQTPPTTLCLDSIIRSRPIS